jgi:predicted ribosome quality control (RQC) complex YloA/Tae2 family protein
MDASVFRFVAHELAPRIVGMRIEKVFTPLPATWTLSLGRAGHLVLCSGKPTPFLCLLPHKPENPAHPDGRAMWLRKRLKNRRILGLVSDWPRRRLALELSSGEGRFLILDLSGDPVLVDTLPPEFGAEPGWPDLERIVADDGLWREHPHLTPPLRHHLRSLPADAARALLRRLAAGDVHVFYHGPDHRGHAQVRLWPLQGGGDCASALDAAERAHGRTLAEKARERSGADALVTRELRRVERALARLEEDAVRLRGMVEKREDGKLLQAHLHALDKHARLERVRVPGPEGEMRELALDPELTVRGNMERYFARAAKGERGLGIVEARTRALRRELEAVRQGTVRPAPGRDTSPEARSGAGLPDRYARLKIAVFRSSDGFLLLRGRSAQANHQLLTKAASPFDYWLHAQGGPGAHVIIKRDFAAQDVPEGTIQEAACLAALSSHLKMAGRGDVLVCLVRDVRPIKGAPMGLVNVDKVLRTVRPVVDPALEERLRLHQEG